MYLIKYANKFNTSAKKKVQSGKLLLMFTCLMGKGPGKLPANKKIKKIKLTQARDCPEQAKFGSCLSE